MAGQSIFFRTVSLLNNGSKMILTNRINRVNFTPTKGLKQDTKDLEKLKIPEKPKRPLTAFFSFMLEKRPIVEKQNPALSSKDIIRKISDEWKLLSTEAKEKYEVLAKRNKTIYEEKILDYTASLTPEQESIIKEIQKEKSDERKRRRLRKELKDEGKPKRPLSSFGLFVYKHSQERGSKGESLSGLMTELKDEWAKMTDAEKKRYRLEYDKNKEQYEKELAAWEAKMIAEGKQQLVRVKTLKEYSSKDKGHKKMPKHE